MYLKIFKIIAIALTLLFGNPINGQSENIHKILIFSKTAGYHHACIDIGSKAIIDLCLSNAIDVDTTTNPAFFNQKNLSKYSAILFFNTTGDVLNGEQEIAFEKYIQSGGGYVGVHAASDTEYEWQWYGELVGAYFISHPKIQEAKFIVEDASFLATHFLPKEWVRTDELYNLRIVNPNIKVILTVDETTYSGGENGSYHPMAWYHEYDGGRAFYTALGHTNESYSEDYFMRHLLGGIQYVIGKN
jgi:type 1 glutamine amidotransferase